MPLYDFLRKIIGKISRKSQKLIVMLLENFLIYLIIRKKFKRYSSAIVGCCNVATDTYFYKIAFKNTVFNLEKDHIEFICGNYPRINALIPNCEYSSVLKNKVSIIKTKKLTAILEHAEQFKCAGNVLDIFKKYGQLRVGRIDDLPYILDGLNVVRFFMGDVYFKKALSLAESFLGNNRFRVGPCHGDFHHKNILCSVGESYYIIDLDCFRKASIQELDAIYFVTQHLADSKGVSWYVALVCLISNKLVPVEYYIFLETFLVVDKLRSYGLIYFLDRIGQDVKYALHPEQLRQDGLVGAVKFLVD